MENTNLPNYERLETAAKFLDGLEKSQFHFNRYILDHTNECPTRCCVLGWSPAIFPGLCKWVKPRETFLVHLKGDEREFTDFSSVGSIIYNLTYKDVIELFYPGDPLMDGTRYPPGPNASAKEVAAHIRQWVANHKEKNSEVAQAIYNAGLLKQPNRKGCLAEARVAILEKRVYMNGRLVTHTETQIPRQPGEYKITLHDLNTGTYKDTTYLQR